MFSNKHSAAAYGNPLANQSYVEEESYMNPPNIDFQSECDYEDQKLNSIADLNLLQKMGGKQ